MSYPFGNKPLLEITQADAQKHYEHWRDRIAGKVGGKTISSDTARRNFGNMRKRFRSCANWLEVDLKNPFDGLSFRLRKSDKREVPPFDVSWIERKFLIPGALNHLNDEARLIFLILIETGCRPSEVWNLMPENICLDHHVPTSQFVSGPIGWSKRRPAFAKSDCSASCWKR